MNSNVKLFALLFVFVFGNFANAQKTSENKNLPNFAVVNEQLLRGAQPTAAGIKLLAARGVKTIIDLRDADKRAESEAVWARAANIKFVNIPLDNWLAPSDERIAEILAAIDAPENQPVFVHCKRGADRTGTVIAAYRISHDNFTAQQARDEAKTRGFGWWQIWMSDFINDYYRDFQKQTANRKND